MIKMKVNLTVEEHKALERLAEREKRYSYQQAAHFIREKLVEMGELKEVAGEPLKPTIQAPAASR